MYKHFHFRAGQPVTIELIKRMYHKLALENHPDRGGDLRTMQEINDEFAQLKKRYYNVHEGQNGGVYRDEARRHFPKAFRMVGDFHEESDERDWLKLEDCDGEYWHRDNFFERHYF